MSAIDYKALAGRIKCLADYTESDPAWDAAETADLRTVVSLLEGMAEEKPVAWVEVADSHEGPYTFHGQELLPAGKHSLYLHPAPQPTAIPAPFMHLFGHAYGLSLGTDWNRGTHAEHYRRPLLDAVAECKRWLDSAPQPQPERQPVSEPTEAQIDIRWLRNVANEGRGAAMTDALHQAIDEIERLRAALAVKEK